MEPSQQTFIITAACLLVVILGIVIYKRYKQTQRLQKLRRSIQKYFSKNDIVFKTASGEVDDNFSDRMKVGEMTTNEAFSNIFQQTQISQPSTKQTTMDLSIDQDEARQQPDFNKVFQKSESRPKKSKLRNRLANKAKVVDQEKKSDQNQFQNLQVDDEIAIE